MTYLKNQSFSINGITFYELGNHTCLNLCHPKVIESQAWMHILKEKRLKLDICSWQKILISYKGKNQYQVYNPRTGKVHIIRDLFINEQHLYYREALNDWDYAEDDWAETDDAQFANADDFESLDKNDLDISDSVRENILKQPEKEGNNF